jgi:exopolyphosphatase/guanosine-5'-triphosphate,3'-diphosphate pyrophosphatase
MNNLQFAAIDIGSNAVRLLIMGINSDTVEPSFNKSLMIRVPLRLGQEAFVDGKINESKAKNLIRLMKAFKHLLKVYNVTDYRVCATAAMREAKNAKELVKQIKKETDLQIEIIDGHEEAMIIYESHFYYNLNEHQNYIFVDVGGGSTEISLLVNGELVQSNSYKIGTVRLLNNKVDEKEYEMLHNDLSILKDKYEINDVIASGGNIIKLNALAKTRAGRKFPLQALEAITDELKQYNVEELIEKYKLKSDRADVIIPAANTYIDVAKSVGAKSFIVPKIGLIDGIIHLLYAKWKEKTIL